MIGQLVRQEGGGFVGGLEAATGLGGQSDAADRAGIDDASASGGTGGFEDISRSGDIGGVHGHVIGQPKVVTGGDMKAPVTTAQGVLQPVAVPQVSLEGFVSDASQAPPITVRSKEGHDAMAAGRQFIDQIGADKTRGAGN